MYNRWMDSDIKQDLMSVPTVVSVMDKSTNGDAEFTFFHQKTNPGVLIITFLWKGQIFSCQN